MIITAGKFEKDFIEDPDELVNLIDEYKKLDDAISNSLHYKMMSGKTQMIGKQEGGYQENGRSRLEHTERIIAIAKQLINKIYDLILENNPEINNSEELRTIFDLNRELDISRTICIIKAHDIGHIAFSHTGEEAMDTFFNMISEPKEVEEILKEHRVVFGDEYEIEQGHIMPKRTDEQFFLDFLSFEHNELSALLLNKIMNENGINLPESERKNTIIGVLAHSTSRVKSFSLIKDNLPAQIVRIADKIEYINTDYEEIKEYVALDEESIRMVNDEWDEETIKGILKYARCPISIRIDLATSEMANQLINKGRIWESREKGSIMRKFRKCYEDAIFLYDSLYSYELLKNELLPRLSNPEELKKFYEENPGVESYYPEEKVRFISTQLEDFEGEKPEAYRMDDPLWDYSVPFKSVVLGENAERIFSIYSKVLEYFYQNPSKIPFRTEAYNTPINGKSDNLESMHFRYELDANYTQKMQRLFEYISLFDDKAMMDKYYELVEERIKYGPGNGIEPVTVQDMKTAIEEGYNSSLEKFRQSSTLTSQESRIPYVIKGNLFYTTRLTKKGKEVYEKNIRKKFTEYEIDKRNYERMVEADKKRDSEGKTMEDYYYDDDFEIEKRKANSIKAKAALTQPIVEENYIDEESKTTVHTDTVPFTGKKKVIVQVEDTSHSIGMSGATIKAKPKDDEVKGFKRLVGRLGLALEILSSRREDDAIEEYIKRKYGKNSKNNPDDPHGDGQK